MPFTSLIQRIAVLVFALGLPFAILGYSLGGPWGLLAAEVLLMLSLLGVAFRGERLIRKIYGSSVAPSPSVTRSLERVIDSLGGKSPRVYVFQDLAPQALVCKSLDGRSAILLSEGLLGLLTEAELRELLEASVLRLRSPGGVFQTVNACLAHGVLMLAPLSWRKLLIEEPSPNERLGAASGIYFFALLALARGFTRLGRAGDQINAPRAFVRYSGVATRVTNPGSCILHLVDPWSSRLLLPL